MCTNYYARQVKKVLPKSLTNLREMLLPCLCISRIKLVTITNCTYKTKNRPNLPMRTHILVKKAYFYLFNTSKASSSLTAFEIFSLVLLIASSSTSAAASTSGSSATSCTNCGGCGNPTFKKLCACSLNLFKLAWFIV